MFQEGFKDRKTVKAVAGICLLMITALASTLVPSLLKSRTEYNIEQFYPKSDPTFLTAQKIREKYQLSESAALVATIQSAQPSWLTSTSVAKLKQITQSLGEVEDIKYSLSFATRAGAVMSDDRIQVGALTEITPEAQWSERFRKDALMTPLLLSRDQRTALVYLELKTTDITQMKVVIAKTNQLLQSAYPEAQIQLGGIPALQSGFQTMLSDEVIRFVALSFVATFLLIFALFKGLAPILLSLTTVVLSNVFVLGGMSALGYSMTVLTVTVPILVTVTVIAQLVHTLLRLHERRKEESLVKHLLVQKDLLLPNFLAVLTTAVGFATLTPSEIPMISNYGWVVGGAMMLSWAVATIALPVMTVLLPDPVPRSWIMMKSRWILYVLRYKKQWTLGVLAFSVIACAGAFSLNWGARLFDDLPKDHQSRLTTELIDQEFGGVIPLDIELQATTSEFWKQPENLRRLDAEMKTLRSWPGVGQAVSLADFLKSFDAQGSFPKTAQEVSELLFLYSLSGQNPTKNFRTSDGKNLRVQMKLKDIPGDEMNLLVARVQEYLQSQFPDVKVAGTGMANHIHPTNNRVSSELIFGFWQALFAIFLILIPVFRSLRWALVACLPNLVTPAILIGAMAIMQTPIKPPLALIFSISLGLAFNNTVYIFERLRQLVKQGRRIRLIEHVFHREGMNCLHSTLVIFAGFGVFLFAQFSVNQSFGAFMLLAIIAGLVADLVFLPALLAWQPALLNLPKPIPRPKLTVVPAGPQPPSFDLDLNIDQESDSSRRSAMASKAASFLAFVVLLSGSVKSEALTASGTPAELKTRFQKAMRQFESKDEEAKVKLSIIEPDGSIVVRELSLQRSGTKNEQRMIARILAPSDLKGTSLLSIVTKDDENQWVYLPSSKQVRKVVSSDTSESGVLGSELRYEDFDPSVIRETEVKLLRSEVVDGKKFDVLEAQIPTGKSPYDRAQVWVSIGRDLPSQIDYFSKGQKQKTIQFLNYKKVGKIVRPHKLVIRNLKNKRGTEIEMSQVKVNKGLSTQKLSVDSLAKAW